MRIKEKGSLSHNNAALGKLTMSLQPLLYKENNIQEKFTVYYSFKQYK